MPLRSGKYNTTRYHKQFRSPTKQEKQRRTPKERQMNTTKEVIKTGKNKLTINEWKQVTGKQPERTHTYQKRYETTQSNKTKNRLSRLLHEENEGDNKARNNLHGERDENNKEKNLTDGGK